MCVGLCVVARILLLILIVSIYKDELRRFSDLKDEVSFYIFPRTAAAASFYPHVYYIRVFSSFDAAAVVPRAIYTPSHLRCCVSYAVVVPCVRLRTPVPPA